MILGHPSHSVSLEPFEAALQELKSTVRSPHGGSQLSWNCHGRCPRARKLKGVKRDKEREGYTGSAPYGEGKSLRPVEVVLIRVSMTRELNCNASLSMRSFFSLNRCRVVPLYREADAQQPLESRPAHRSVRLGL